MKIDILRCIGKDRALHRWLEAFGNITRVIATASVLEIGLYKLSIYIAIGRQYTRVGLLANM